MNAAFKKFWEAEDGAVTVDWVVLTAAIVGLGVTVSAAVINGTVTASEGIGDTMAELIDEFAVDQSQTLCDASGACVTDSDGDGVADLFTDPDGNELDISEDGYTMEDLASNDGFDQEPVVNETN